jgi:hypothetical protein
MEKDNIFTFKVEKSEKKQVETKRKNKKTGEEETVIQNKTVKTPVSFFVKRPKRRLVDEAEVQYAVELSKAIKQGIVTKAMLVKKYSDTGGPLTEDESKNILKAIKEISDLENERQMLVATKGKGSRIKEIEDQILTIRKDMIEFENAVQGIYQHTADARAERSLLMWYTINLSFYEAENGELTPFFEGITYEDQLESLYSIDEQDEGYKKEALDTIMKAVSYWFYTQKADQEEIAKFIKNA